MIICHTPATHACHTYTCHTHTCHTRCGPTCGPGLIDKPQRRLPLFPRCNYRFIEHQVRLRVAIVILTIYYRNPRIKICLANNALYPPFGTRHALYVFYISRLTIMGELWEGNRRPNLHDRLYYYPHLYPCSSCRGSLASGLFPITRCTWCPLINDRWTVNL